MSSQRKRRPSKAELYPLYNHIFTAFSLSPFYLPTSSETAVGLRTAQKAASKSTPASGLNAADIFLTPRVLKRHAASLRNALVGDFLGSSSVGAGAGAPADNAATNITIDRTAGGRLGRLWSCAWDLLPSERDWDRAVEEGGGESEDEDELSRRRPGRNRLVLVEPEQARGILISLHFEHASHIAILLRKPPEEEPGGTGLNRFPSFSGFPMLLTSMPASLKRTLLDYISRTFDCRISPLRLSGSKIGLALERALQSVDDIDGDGDDEAPLSTMVKSIQVQLTFPSAAPMLRSAQLAMTGADVAKFVDHGHTLPDRSRPPPEADPAGPGDDAALFRPSGPFTRALGDYLHTHMSLDLGHASVRLARVSCLPMFVLSADGKLKFFPGAAGSDTSQPSGPDGDLFCSAGRHTRALQRVLDIVLSGSG